MFQKLLRETTLTLDEQSSVSVSYYETRTITGAARFSAEVIFKPEGRMILDADSVSRLETKLTNLVQISRYSRRFAATGGAA